MAAQRLARCELGPVPILNIDTAVIAARNAGDDEWRSQGAGQGAGQGGSHGRDQSAVPSSIVITHCLSPTPIHRAPRGSTGVSKRIVTIGASNEGLKEGLRRFHNQGEGSY